MYNQSGMGGEQLRSPLSMPNLPLPPDLPGMHMQEKALNLQVLIRTLLNAGGGGVII